MTPFKAGMLYSTVSTSPSGVVTRDGPKLNLVPEEGLNHLLNVTFHGAVAVPTWYIFLFESNYTPTGSITAANMASLLTECTAYTATTRVEFVESAASGGSTSNAASLARFTFNAAKTVYGCGLIASAAKGSNVGPLISIVRFSSPKVQENGSSLDVFAGPTATPVL